MNCFLKLALDKSSLETASPASQSDSFSSARRSSPRLQPGSAASFLNPPAAFKLNIELKNYEVFYPGLEERAIAEIREAGMEDQVFASSFNHISMQRFKTLCPEMETGLLCRVAAEFQT